MSEMKKLSVIIVSYNSLKLIKDCLDSVQRYNDIGDSLEVIVVEQSPKEEIFEVLSKEYTWVKTVRNSNMGYGGGNNAGVRHATGDILLFLNPDTLLIEPVFGYILSKYEEDKSLGICGCRLLGGNRNYVQSFFWKDSISNVKGVLWRFLDRMDRFIPKKMYITGADIFVPKQAFEDAGWFDENLFMYCEETDICNRVEKLGLNTKFFPEKKIIHLEGKTSEENYVKKEILKLKSFITVAVKNGDSKERIIKSAIAAAKHRSLIFFFINKNRYMLEKELIQIYKSGAF